MNQTGVYICPSCQQVVRAEGRRGEEIICDACGYSFGSVAGQVNKTSVMAEARPAQLLAHSTAVVRNAASPSPVSRQSVTSVQKPLTQKPQEKPVVENANAKANAKAVEASEANAPIREKVSHRKPKKKKRAKLIYTILAAWFLILGLIVGILKSGYFETFDQPDEKIVEAETVIEKKYRHFLNNHRNAVSDVFGNYLKTPIQTGKTQFIHRSAELASNFLSFYELENEVSLDISNLYFDKMKVVEFAQGKVTPGIEVLWGTKDGHNIETTFIWEDEAWKLDWESFSRYSSTSWALFRLGVGDVKEGEFRLFVRRKEIVKDNVIDVMFYGPARPGLDERANLYSRASPGVSIPRDSPLGSQFHRMWNDFSSGETPYNSLLAEKDPRGMMRITVKLAWEENEYKEKVMVLREILEPSWYGVQVRDYFDQYSGISKKNSK